MALVRPGGVESSVSVGDAVHGPRQSILVIIGRCGCYPFLLRTRLVWLWSAATPPILHPCLSQSGSLRRHRLHSAGGGTALLQGRVQGWSPRPSSTPTGCCTAPGRTSPSGLGQAQRRQRRAPAPRARAARYGLCRSSRLFCSTPGQTASSRCGCSKPPPGCGAAS